MSAPVSSAACQNGSRSAASSVEPTPRGSVPIMAPAKPAFTASLSTLGGARAVAERHGRQRHEMRLGLRRGEQCIVGEPGPGLAFGARQLVAEHVDPAADHLLVDALSWPSRRAARQYPTAASTPAASACRRQRPSASPPPSSICRTLGNFAASLRIAASNSGGTRWAWQSTIIQFPFLVRACAIRSPSVETLIGSVLMEMPSGRIASLTALAIAAGAPR